MAEAAIIQSMPSFDIGKWAFYPEFVEVFTPSAAATTPIVSEGPIARVARVVQRHLDEVETQITQQVAAFDPAIEGYVTYAIGSRGKRLRPLLALLSGGATGAVTTGHVDLAVIVELIHVATLVHDDIMDEAERRRSQPTVNARWGNSLSVLLGDCLFAQALNLSTNFDNAEISRAIARAAKDVCSGEIIQTQRRFDLHLAIDDYLRIIKMKTGSLFAVAAELGATINGAGPDAIHAMKAFGLKFGAAYQIYDDCLDIAGSENATGKTLGTDLRKGKMTLPVLTLLQNTPAIDREHCCELILGGRSSEIAALLKMASADGALSASLDAGQESIRDAQRNLDGLPPTAHSDALVQLCDALRDLFDQLRS